MAKKEIRRLGSDLGDPINTKSTTLPPVKQNPIKPSDTTHVTSSVGYEMAVAKGSNYAKQAKTGGGILPANLRPGGPYTEDNDTFSVKNYPKKKKK